MTVERTSPLAALPSAAQGSSLAEKPVGRALLVFLRLCGTILALAILMLCLTAGPGRAAQAAAPAANATMPATRATTLETITVTAFKRESDLQKTPASITALQGADLDAHGVQDLSQATLLAPNVHMKQASSGGGPVIRGISTFDTSLTNAVSLYIDDIAYPLNYMTDQQLFDVERVEFLRGPQGTLYGRNSEAGVVNVVLRTPDNEPRADLRTEVGAYNTYRLTGAVNAPLVEDILSLGISGNWLRTDGFIKNDSLNDSSANEKRDVAGRATLRWTPTKAWDVSLTADAGHDDLGQSSLRREQDPMFTVKCNVQDDSKEDEHGEALRMRYEADNIRLVSVTGYRNYNKRFTSDLDRSPANAGWTDMDMETGHLSQELRVSSVGEQRWDWLAGLYAFSETMETGFDRTTPLAATTSQRATDVDGHGVAGFGEMTWHMLPDLRLTGGLRLDYSHSEASQAYTPATGRVDYDAELDNTEVLPSVTLAYDIARDVTTYATWSQGFLAGGYNYNLATGSGNLVYDPEYTTNYEIGLKTAWLDGALTVNGALFHTEIEDKQVLEGTGMANWKISNAAEAHATGGELEVHWTPLPGLILDGGMGYVSSVIDDWTDGVSGKDYSGKRLPWVPETTWNIGAGYTHSSGLFVRADVLGVGRQYFDAANTLSQNDYQTVDLRTGYLWNDVTLTLWARNAFDTRYATKKTYTTALLVEDGAPRTFGISVEWRF